MNATLTCEYDVRATTGKNRKITNTGELQHHIDLDAPLEEAELYRDLLERTDINVYHED